MKRLLTLVLFSTLISINVVAQDFHLAQYDAPPLFLNPAMTGKFNGKYRLHAHYRTQWKVISTRPFTTGLISFDKAFGKWAFGVQLINNNAGAGSYNVAGGLVSAAYTLPLTKDGNHQLSIGVHGGAFQKSVDYNKLTFETQYTVQNGGGFNTSLPSGENIGNAQTIVPDVNAGLLYFYGKEEARVNPFVGYTLFHINQPSESFYNDKSNKLPMRHIGHVGVKYNLSESIQLLPKAIYMNQGNVNELLVSMVGHFYLKNMDSYIIFGPYYRTTLANQDAAVIELGGKFKDYIARVSYDINISTLKASTDGRGAFEISVTYIPKNRKPITVPNCPRI